MVQDKPVKDKGRGPLTRGAQAGRNRTMRIKRPAAGPGSAKAKTSKPRVKTVAKTTEKAQAAKPSGPVKVSAKPSAPRGAKAAAKLKSKAKLQTKPAAGKTPVSTPPDAAAKPVRVRGGGKARPRLRQSEPPKRLAAKSARAGKGVALARFAVGDVVRHKFYPFRGVIFDIDPVFANTDEWWLSIPEQMRPRKNQPFYHLLAENAETEYIAYVSEQNLLPDTTGVPVRHPQVAEYFVEEEDGRYRPVFMGMLN